MFLLCLLCSLNSWTTKNITSQRSTKHLKNEFNWRVKSISSSEDSFLRCGPPKTPKHILELRRCIKGAMPLTYWKVYAMFSAWRRWSSELESYQNWPLLHHQLFILFSLGTPMSLHGFFWAEKELTPSETHVFFSHFYRGDITTIVGGRFVAMLRNRVLWDPRHQWEVKVEQKMWCLVGLCGIIGWTFCIPSH